MLSAKPHDPRLENHRGVLFLTQLLKSWKQIVQKTG